MFWSPLLDQRAIRLSASSGAFSLMLDRPTAALGGNEDRKNPTSARVSRLIDGIRVLPTAIVAGKHPDWPCTKSHVERG
jgi:hypothetical protein